MPMTAKGAKIIKAMKSEYGAKKGEQVFYASKNAKKIKGVEKEAAYIQGFNDKLAASPMSPELMSSIKQLLGHKANIPQELSKAVSEAAHTVEAGRKMVKYEKGNPQRMATLQANRQAREAFKKELRDLFNDQQKDQYSHGVTRGSSPLMPSKTPSLGALLTRRDSLPPYSGKRSLAFIPGSLSVPTT